MGPRLGLWEGSIQNLILAKDTPISKPHFWAGWMSGSVYQVQGWGGLCSPRQWGLGMRDILVLDLGVW